MPATAAKALVPSPAESAFDHGPCRARPSRRLSAILVGLTLAVVLLSSPIVAAATASVSQEQVIAGTTDGIAGVQAEDGLRETMREVDVAPDPLAYPGVQTLTKGAQVAGIFPTDVQASDGVYVQYREGTPPAVTVQNNPTAVAAGCTWTACGNGTLSDNSYASSSAGGDYAAYVNFGFTIPTAATITGVEVGYEAFEPTGNDRLGITISWDGGVSWCPAKTTAIPPAADPNAYTFLDFTACTGHSWTPSDFRNVTTSITHAAQGPPETIYLDANVVRVTYQPLAYELLLRYDWTGVPSGQRHDLILKGHISDENMTVQVLTPPSVWTTRLNLTTATDQVLTYTLNAGEYNSGNVSIRFVNANGPDTVQSSLWIDGALILTVVLAYHLDVVQIVTGVTGIDPVLAIKGNISAGGENFDVSVWNFTANAWAFKMGSVFTPINEIHTAILFPDEIGNGAVRINYQDRDPTDLVPATLTLDLVEVTTTGPAPSLSGIVLVGGAVAAVFAVIFLVFFVVLPRRRSSAADPPPPRRERRFSPPSWLRGTSGVASPTPQIGVGDLQPGHPYLVEEEEPAKALRVLERLTQTGRSGLLITRRNPLDVLRVFKLRHTKTMWLGDGQNPTGGKNPTASLEAISSAVNEFLKTNPVGALLIDGIKDLVDGNDFRSVLDFIGQTSDFVSLGEQIFLVGMRPGTFQGRELRLLAQKMDVVRLS